MTIKKIIKKKKIGFFIICRLESKRLKQKITRKVLGFSLLEILVKRLIKKFGNDKIVICTSGKENFFFSEIVKKYNIKIFYGDSLNIFKRTIDAAQKYDIKNFARITGDNPLTDLDCLEKMISLLDKKNFDYIYTNGLFDGLKPEIYSIKGIKKCSKLAEDQNSSEYLTYYYLRKKIFKIFCLKQKKNKKEKFVSITIDKFHDLLNLKSILKLEKDLYINKNEILKRLKKQKEKKLQKLIPLKTKKYNARLITDLKDMKFINLKDFSL
jgi:spore coat polysaccharide biosynthesis protein SpsF (cytidylyltransferase family)